MEREKDLLIQIKTIARGIEPYIGRRPQILSFVYGKDLAAAVISACTADRAVHGSYNISDGHIYSKYEFASIIKKIMRKKTVIINPSVKSVSRMAGLLEFFSRKKMPLLNKDKISELTGENWVCSIEKAQDELKYDPKYDLESGLKNTIHWYKDHGWL